MRVLYDTNIFISYLLSETTTGTIAVIMRGVLQGRCTLLLPDEVLQEMVAAIEHKPHIADRIAPERVTAFMKDLQAVAEVIPPIREAIPPVSRDAKDNYLLAYALIGRADYLVTGDDDLLSLDRIGTVTILRPSDFADLLANE
jgi:putative PIN family toxin of toxin-antitoxin system